MSRASPRHVLLVGEPARAHAVAPSGEERCAWAWVVDGPWTCRQEKGCAWRAIERRPGSRDQAEIRGREKGGRARASISRTSAPPSPSASIWRSSAAAAARQAARSRVGGTAAGAASVAYECHLASDAYRAWCTSATLVSECHRRVAHLALVGAGAEGGTSSLPSVGGAEPRHNLGGVSARSRPLPAVPFRVEVREGERGEEGAHVARRRGQLQLEGGRGGARRVVIRHKRLVEEARGEDNRLVQRGKTRRPTLRARVRGTRRASRGVASPSSTVPSKAGFHLPLP